MKKRLRLCMPIRLTSFNGSIFCCFHAFYALSSWYDHSFASKTMHDCFVPSDDLWFHFVSSWHGLTFMITISSIELISFVCFWYFCCRLFSSVLPAISSGLLKWYNQVICIELSIGFGLSGIFPAQDFDHNSRLNLLKILWLSRFSFLDCKTIAFTSFSNFDSNGPLMEWMSDTISNEEFERKKEKKNSKKKAHKMQINKKDKNNMQLLNVMNHWILHTLKIIGHFFMLFLVLFSSFEHTFLKPK